MADHKKKRKNKSTNNDPEFYNDQLGENEYEEFDQYEEYEKDRRDR